MILLYFKRTLSTASCYKAQHGSGFSCLFLLSQDHRYVPPHPVVLKLFIEHPPTHTHTQSKQDPKKEREFIYRAVCALCEWYLCHLIKSESGRRYSEILRSPETEAPSRCLTRPHTQSPLHT